MNLYVLRAHMRETYDCPDNGLIEICERYEDIEFSTRHNSLEAKAADLNKGHTGYWSESRANALHRMHSGYNDEYTYSVHDVSELMSDELN